MIGTVLNVVGSGAINHLTAAADKGGSGRFCRWLDIILRTEDMKGKSEMKKDRRGINATSKPSGNGVCRMPGVTERLVASSPSVCGVWAHRLLRQFPEPTCVQACGSNGALDHCQLRAGRGLVLRLREAWDDQGCEVASAAFASRGSTGTWTSRKSSSQLGIVAALAGVDHFECNSPINTLVPSMLSSNRYNTIDYLSNLPASQ